MIYLPYSIYSPYTAINGGDAVLIPFASAMALSLVLLEYFLSGTSIFLFTLSAVPIFILCRYIARKRNVKSERITAAFIGCIFGVLLFIAYSSIVYEPALAYAGSSAQISGAVASEPDRDGTRVIVRVSSINDEQIKLPFKIILYLDEEIHAVPGDNISISASLKVPNTYDNFDALRHYKSRGIYLTAVAESSADILSPDTYPIWSLPLHISSDMKKQIKEILPSEENSALVTALLLGDDSQLSREFSDSISDIGLSHIISVSGMHVSFISNLLLLIFGLSIGPFVAIPILILFTLVAGAPAAAVRALIMQLILLLSFIVKREPDTKSSLFFALIFILLLNPFAICDVSLWLSFSATLGLILYSNPIMTAIMKPFSDIENRLIQKLISSFASVIGSTFAALFLSTPILIITFHTVSIISPLANLLLLFPFELLFFGGLISTSLSYISPSLGSLLGVLLEPIYKFIEFITFSLAELRFAKYSVDSVYTVSLFFCIYIIFAIYIILRQRKDRKISINFRYIAAACAICVCVTVFCEWYDRSHSTYTAILDSQGAQCVIMHDDTHTIMINCGGYSTSYDAATYLDRIMAEKVDLLIITDYRSGSIKSVTELLDTVDVDKIIMPPAGNSQEAEKLKEITAKDIDIEFISSSCSRNTGDISYYIGAYDSRLFVRLQHGTLSLLAPGALTPEVLGKALYDIGYPHTTVVAAGSYYSSHELPGSVQKLTPSVCVVSEYYPMSSKRMKSIAGNIPSVIDGTMSGNIVLRCADTNKGYHISLVSSHLDKEYY